MGHQNGACGAPLREWCLVPFGMLIGAFLGAVALELLISKRLGDALRAGWGVFVGALTAMVLKLTASGAMTYYFIRALL